MTPDEQFELWWKENGEFISDLHTSKEISHDTYLAAVTATSQRDAALMEQAASEAYQMSQNDKEREYVFGIVANAYGDAKRKTEATK